VERPKYLEYRHRRDQIARYNVERSTKVTLQKPAMALLRLVGKKTSASSDSFQEQWVVETRTSDVHPDYSGLVKVQVTEATKLIKGEPVGYDQSSDPTTLFLNETVDRFGKTRDLSGSLPTPHILVFPEEPQLSGGEWEESRLEMLPVTGPNGQVAGYEAMTVTYRCRVDQYGDDSVEYADITVTGNGRRGEESDPVWQEYSVSGQVRFAIREGHLLTGKVERSMASHLGGNVITSATTEDYTHASQDKERSVGGMRL